MGVKHVVLSSFNPTQAQSEPGLRIRFFLDGRIRIRFLYLAGRIYNQGLIYPDNKSIILREKIMRSKFGRIRITVSFEGRIWIRFFLEGQIRTRINSIRIRNPDE